MPRPILPRQLRAETPLIAPSMLKCDFSNLQREIAMLESARADVLHWDVMDGHFVPNLSYGAMVIRSVRELTSLPFDAHLMISDPGKYLDDFLNAGCDWMTIHIEAETNPEPLLQRIRKAGCGAGLALNPQTPVSAVEPYLSLCDLVLVMSVEPGFGGQSFMPDVLTKVRDLAQQCADDTLISIDGGIGLSTVEAAAEAGAHAFVAGSAVFETKDYAAAIAELRDRAGRQRPSATVGV